jgi:crotonobetainyl-CoA:carnitine CoA-transferase CaiB-like acyl-CoA transferase
MNQPGALAGLRVLDLTDVKGHLCSRLLGDMGADIIKVEPPGGDDARRIGPFVDDRPHRDRSLFFWFYNFNKRSLTLDLNDPEGAAILRRLAAGADVVVESFKPGALERMGLGWDALHALNPALILCSIAPFGQSGPYRGWEADDSVLTALSGMLYVNGFPKEAPVRPLGLQAYHSASYYGAIATMCALFARDATGEGQWIDLSMQESTASAVEHVSAGYFGSGLIEPRRGSLHWSRFFRVARCRDGYIMHCTLGDWTSLIEWVNGDGKAQDLTDAEWADFVKRRDDAEHLFDVLDEWVKDYSSRELLERAQTLRLPYASVRNPEALFTDEQLEARGYFHEVEHPELGRKFRYPGAPYLFGGSPWSIRRRPPLVGEHTGEILAADLGMSTEEIAALAAEGVI